MHKAVSQIALLLRVQLHDHSLPLSPAPCPPHWARSLPFNHTGFLWASGSVSVPGADVCLGYLHSLQDPLSGLAFLIAMSTQS